MREEARLLTSDAASTEDKKVERLLAFFGVECARTKPDEFVREVEDAANEHAYRLLCSAAVFAEVRNRLSPTQVHSVFVYSGDHDKSAPQALSESESVPIFFSLAPKLIDIEAELTTSNFEVRKHELSAVPIVKYVRWAFPRTAWHAPEANACLIIDDPLLRPRYGFIRFDKLLGLMERHNFTASIAFIPWNWRRNNRRTVELFKQNRARYSICIHGCDHTATEFGTNNADALRSKTATAVQRMSAHAQNSGLVHDQVMVFPQGVFSPAAIGMLKEANFLAVVNTEVKSSSPPNRPVRIADVWQTAVMLYDDFPIYTRRYPRQGVENVAFDLLLGKPCFIVIHHDYCRDGCKTLVEFVDRLNALPYQLQWRSLAEVIKRSYRQREVSEGITEVEMYGSEILLENSTPATMTFRIRKQETNASILREVRVGAELVSPTIAEGFLRFEVTLKPGETTNVSLHFNHAAAPRKDGVKSPLKTRLRRYLSEVRDNYLLPAKARFARSSR